MKIQAYAAKKAGGRLEPFDYDAGPLRDNEVEIDVTHCGICHSDLCMIDNDWQMSSFPLVPGHEIIGHVAATGAAVRAFNRGERVGVGWQSGSCRTCEWCLRGMETCCAAIEGIVVGRHGGFAEKVRVDARFAFAIPEGLPSDMAAPLLCGGITVYSPLRSVARQGLKIGVIGIGGLGHLALRFARALGCQVVAFSTTAAKEKEARELGAHHFVCTAEPSFFQKMAGSLDALLSAVSADLLWDAWLGLLRPHGTLILVGVSPGPMNFRAFSLIGGNKSVRGSVIGDPRVIREMLDFAERNKIAARSEALAMSDANEGIDRVRKNLARYRVVLKR